MDGLVKPVVGGHLSELRPAALRILEVQTSTGAIPWFEDGPWDPWNHTECAMALTAVGEFEAAKAAFDHLTETQRKDGAWFGEYGNALPMVDRDYISREPAPAFLDSNFCAYPAVGVAHYLLATGDRARALGWWPMVRAAIDFVLTLQRPDGSISWAFEALGTDQDDALLAGNASIAKSLSCALWLANELGEAKPEWQASFDRLALALRDRPEAFDQRGTGSRFAMDWYYPVLSGVLDQTTTKARLTSNWDTYVLPAYGCRCVSDEPWITVAESAELVMALLAAGDRDLAVQIYSNASGLKDRDNVFWMGWQTEEEIFWPREKPSWTQAAMILAADALFGDGAASRLLVDPK